MRAVRRIQAVTAAALAGLGLMAVSVETDAKDTEIESPEGAESTPAVRYATLDQAACEAELTKRGVSFTREADVRGVLAPVRLTGPVRGITYRSMLPEKQRATSPWEIVDCRLALALDDFAQVLARHDVREVVHFSVYRPPPLRGWLDGMLGKRHSGALAIDAGRFVLADGTALDVERDFGGRIGQKTCGPKAAAPADAGRPSAPRDRVRRGRGAPLQRRAHAALQQGAQESPAPRGHARGSLVLDSLNAHRRARVSEGARASLRNRRGAAT
ncbi:MAG: hypothetical protein U0235_16420 [Polyangiaceae bacterium]